MKLGRNEVSGMFGVTAVLLSPIAFLGATLLAIAVGHDFLYFSGETPIALGLCAPAAYVVVRWVVPPIVARLRASFTDSSFAASEAGD